MPYLTECVVLGCFEIVNGRACKRHRICPDCGGPSVRFGARCPECARRYHAAHGADRNRNGKHRAEAPKPPGGRRGVWATPRLRSTEHGGGILPFESERVLRSAPVAQTPAGPCRAGHAHHWVIESPSGPTSPGVCRLCGAAQDFKNAYDGYTEEQVAL